MSDGTYKQLLVSYNLTVQEKQILLNGGAVDPKGKLSVTELGQGTYNPMGSKLQDCQWVDNSFFTSCSEGLHHHGEQSPTCVAGTKSELITDIQLQCQSVGDGGGGFGVGGGSSGGGSSTGEPGSDHDNNDPGSNTSPCPNGGTLTSPPGLTTDPGDGNCSGIPTQINLPERTTPCVKIKLQRADTEFSSRTANLQGKTGLKKETGYIQRADGDYTYKDNASATDEKNSLSIGDLNNPANKDIKGYMHTHVNDYWYTDINGEYRPKQGIKIFSPADISVFMDVVKNAQDAGRPLRDVYAVMVTSKGNYQIRFTGNQYQIKTFTAPETNAHREPFQEFMKKKIDKQKDSEFGMLKYMDEKMNLKGVSLYRMNADGSNTEIKLNATKTDREEVNCPS